MAPSLRSGAGRASVRGGTRPSAARHALGRQTTRAGAASPAGSAAGAKRKERDFDADEGGESTNINVVVRCRGRNEREVRENSAVVVSTDGAKGKLVDLSMGPNALSNKTYNFDRVFSPAADQSMIFDDVVKPVLDEMLAGYNCTIFAYGQTGTGKTYTMSGDMSDTLGLLSDAAGIIPRVLHALFNKLQIDDTENSVRCSFIELYNEELRDLLAADDSTKLKIYDDASRRGTSTTVVQGVEERHITSATDGLRWLQEGSVRRQVAATKCNDLSSRSHTVFTITVHAKKKADDGSDDFFRSGKLNLVDLAGSENIQRSGAENKRAAEAGLINKSLLTLGRVINALVDKSAHIPYRESKLTRLLQDSLGGQTKTCIIATVSPARSNLEETISTLDYAFRAKNIRNKPQINAMVHKKTLLRELSAEIERLKSDLIATRQRNGVYLSNEAYEEMTVQNESRRILTEEQAAKMETMEINLRSKVQELVGITANFMGLKKDFEGVRAQLDGTKEVLDQTELVLATTRRILASETHLRRAHEQTEEQLAAAGGELMATVRETVGDVDALHAKDRRRSDLQNLNRSTWGLSQTQVAGVTDLVEGRIREFRRGQETQLASAATRMHEFVREERQRLAATRALLDENLAQFGAAQRGVAEQRTRSKGDMDGVLEEIRGVRESIQERVGQSLETIAAAAERIAAEMLGELGTFHEQLHVSYSTLGKEFRTVFEELARQMGAQRAESDRLRRQLETASGAMVEANESVAAQIQGVLEQERRQAAEERQQLLSQITGLITSQAQLQESRLADKGALLQKTVAESNRAFEGGVAQYSSGMDAWGDRGAEILGDMHKSKAALKTKLQDDWGTANQHSTSIRDTARSVHGETMRVVEEQKDDLDEQMQALDDFVARARTENEEHHRQDSEAMRSLSGTVETTFSHLSSDVNGASERVRDLGDDMASDTKTLGSALAPLEDNVCRPLTNLRDDINGTTLREYEPTGDTPEKKVYQYPTELPRTAVAPEHEAVVRQGRLGLLSPSKSGGMPPPAIFSDVADTPTSTKSTPVNATRDDDDGQPRNPLSMSLREVNPNLTAGQMSSFDPAASTMSMPPVSSTMPLKQSTSTVSNATAPAPKPVTRFAARKQAMEGRENVPPVLGRRKSPRLR